MLIKRIATAIIGAMAAGYIIYYGQWLYAIAVGLLAVLAWCEFCRMFREKLFFVWFRMGIVSIILFLGCAWLGNAQEMNLLIIVTTLLVMAGTVIKAEFNIANAAMTLMGILYIGLTFAHLLLLRFADTSAAVHSPLGELSAGAAFVWIAFIGTWASDTFAFLVGSRFGCHKLCPSISPGKTMEGAVGGLTGTIVTVLILGYLFNFAIIHSLWIGLIIGLTAPLGDLTESAIKRFTGVKDSGTILPGHGGILDRFDSIMFVAPAVYYYGQIFILS